MKARKHCKRAEETSNLDTENDENSRKRKRPKRFASDTETPEDEGSENEEPTTMEPIQPIPRPTICGRALNQTRGLTTHDLLQQVISKLEALEEEVKIIRRYFKTEIDEGEYHVDTMLPGGKQLDTTAELEEFENQLNEDNRRKIINSLASLQGGSDAGMICRAIMRAMMTNNLMSGYSGTGQKGKLAFIDKPIYKIIMSSARKASHKTLAFREIRAEMLEVLRNAPNKPGGSNHVKKHGQRQQMNEQDSE